MRHADSDIFSAALHLPESKRLELASRLIESVEGPDEPEWETAWEDEVERRELDGGDLSDPLATWTKVRQRALQRLPPR